MPEPPARATRRRLLGLAAGASLGLAPLLRPPRVAALRQWCRTDPVVKIGGHTAHVYVSAYVKNMKQARRLATGPTQLVITVPANVPARHVASDKGFGHGYAVSFEELEGTDPGGAPPTPIPVRVRAYVPMADGGVSIRVRFVPRRPGRLARGGAEGTANAWIGFTAP